MNNFSKNPVWVILVLLFSVLLYSCNESSTESSNVEAVQSEEIDQSEPLSVIFPENNNTIVGSLSQIASDIEYIPLETTSECLLGKYGFRTTESEYGYFLLSDFILYRFSKDGKFICRINIIGNGPGEYKCKSYLVNDSSQMIVSEGHYRSVFYFSDLEGNLLYTKPNPYKNTSNYVSGLVHFQNDKFVVCFANYDGKAELLYSVIDYQGNVVHEEINTYALVHDFRVREFAVKIPRAYTNQSNFYYWNDLNDTIYKLNTDYSKEIHAVINFGDQKATKEEMVKNSSGLLDFDVISKKGYIANLRESNRFLFILYRSNDKSHLAVIDIKSEKMAFNYDKTFNDDLDNFLPLSILPGLVTGNAIISVIQAFDFIDSYNNLIDTQDYKSIISDKIKNLYESISENDNPILIKVSLKDIL